MTLLGQPKKPQDRENENQKRRKKRRELDAYLSRRKCFQQTDCPSGATKNLLDNEDYTDDSYVESTLVNKSLFRFRSCKGKRLFGDIFMTLWICSWIIGTIFSLWFFFDIKEHFTQLQREINEVTDNNKRLPNELEESQQMVTEYKMVQTKLMTRIRNLEERFRNVSTQNRRYLQNVEKLRISVQEVIKTYNFQSLEMDNLKKSNLQFERKFREIQEISSNSHNNRLKLVSKFVDSKNLIGNNLTNTNRSRQFNDDFKQHSNEVANQQSAELQTQIEESLRNHPTERDIRQSTRPPHPSF